MLQVKTFSLPFDEEKANKFLANHRPEGEIIFNNDLMKVFYQDGEFGPGQELGELHELLMACHRTIVQKQVMVAVLESELAILKPRREECDALAARLKETKERIATLSSGMAQLKKDQRQARAEQIEKLEEEAKELAAKANDLTRSANQSAERETAHKEALESIEFTKVKMEYLSKRIAELKAQLPKDEKEYEDGEVTAK